MCLCAFVCVCVCVCGVWIITIEHQTFAVCRAEHLTVWGSTLGKLGRQRLELEGGERFCEGLGIVQTLVNRLNPLSYERSMVAFYCHSTAFYCNSLLSFYTILLQSIQHLIAQAPHKFIRVHLAGSSQVISELESPIWESSLSGSLHVAWRSKLLVPLSWYIIVY